MTTKAQSAVSKESIRGNSEAMYRTVYRAMVENLFGKQHWATEWVLELCDADPQFPAHLAEQASDYAHFLCLIRLGLLKDDANNRNAQSDAHLLRTSNEKALLNRVFPSCPPNFISILPKLQKAPLCESDYQALIRVSKSKMWGMPLFRDEYVKLSYVRAVDSCFDEMMNFFRKDPILNQYISAAIGLLYEQDSKDYTRLMVIITAMKKLNPKITEREFKKAAKKSRSIGELERWLTQKIAKMPIPSPPWDGNDSIYPVRSRADFEEAARLSACEAARLSACDVDRYIARVVVGYDYIYMCEQPPAMVEAKYDPFFGWSIVKITSRNEIDLESSAKNAIKRTFFEAGFSPNPYMWDEFRRLPLYIFY